VSELGTVTKRLISKSERDAFTSNLQFKKEPNRYKRTRIVTDVTLVQTRRRWRKGL